MDNDPDARVQDGPSSDEGSGTEDQGATSQDRPGDAEASGGSGDAGREHHEPERPHDTNEGADDRASVIEPDGGPSPRA